MTGRTSQPPIPFGPSVAVGEAAVVETSVIEFLPLFDASDCALSPGTITTPRRSRLNYSPGRAPFTGSAPLIWIARRTSSSTAGGVSIRGGAIRRSPPPPRAPLPGRCPAAPPGEGRAGGVRAEARRRRPAPPPPPPRLGPPGR